MPGLSVTCPDGLDQDSPRVVNGIVNLVHDFLEDNGASGEWELELFKKTGGGGQEKIGKLRRTDLPGGSAIVCQVRPHDRDSSWKVILRPPDGFDLEKILAPKSEQPEPAQQDQPEQPVEAPPTGVVFSGQVCFSKVKSQQKHGLNIEIEEKGETVDGFIPLADLGGYNPNILKKYPVGKVVKVVVCDTTRTPITCSTRVDAVLESEDSQDVFTGTPNQDGLLSLKTFACNFKRIYELVEALIPAMVSSKENFISYDRSIEEATKYLLWKYNSTSVDPRAVPAILRQLCGFMKAMPTPLLARHASGKGYELTDFAWSELGGRDFWFDRPSPLPSYEKPPGVEKGVEENQEVHESLLVALPEEPSDVAPEEPTEEVDEVVPSNPVADSTEIRDCAEDVSICLESAAQYLGKVFRLADISSQLSSLQAEKKEIEDWLEKHKELKGLMKELQSLSSVPRNRVEALTKP